MGKPRFSFWSPMLSLHSAGIGTTDVGTKQVFILMAAD